MPGVKKVTATKFGMFGQSISRHITYASYIWWLSPFLSVQRNSLVHFSIGESGQPGTQHVAGARKYREIIGAENGSKGSGLIDE